MVTTGREQRFPKASANIGGCRECSEAIKAHYDCIKAFSETDFTEDLKKMDIPVLVMHGDDDQIVPIVAAGLLSAKILKNATLKVYPGFPHGMPATNAEQINADLLTFFKGAATSVSA